MAKHQQHHHHPEQHQRHRQQQQQEQERNPNILMIPCASRKSSEQQLSNKIEGEKLQDTIREIKRGNAIFIPLSFLAEKLNGEFKFFNVFSLQQRTLASFV